ncbi:hypothetical protein GCM10010342_46900 [Streptomyces anulatus]|nr:hypothetical protein GCM10010342_46900 [Streptomyces anulatus]
MPAASWTGRGARSTRRTYGPSKGGPDGSNPVDRGNYGSKIGLITERSGLPISVGISGANLHDSQALISLVKGIPPIRSPEAGDGASPAKSTPPVASVEAAAELRAANAPNTDDCAVDGSHVQALKGGDHVGPSPVDRGRLGSKHHVIVGSQGIPLAVSLTGGNRHDVTQLITLLDPIPRIGGLRGRPRNRPKRMFADRGYDFDKYRRLLCKSPATGLLHYLSPPTARTEGSAGSSVCVMYEWF